MQYGEVEKALGDIAIKEGWKISKRSNELKHANIAVIGGGPSGLTCAAFLARDGANVTIYEKNSELGGVLMYGIPKFRLDEDILRNQIKKILELGIKVETKKEMGIDFSLDELESKYDAVFLGVGAKESKKLNIAGEDLDGVYGASEILTTEKMKMNYDNKRVVVIGGRKCCA